MTIFKKLTENRYSLNDIFVKNSEGWLAVALLIYPLSHFIHIIYYTFNCRFSGLSFEDMTHLMKTSQFPGDRFIEIINAFVIPAFIVGIIAIVSKLIFRRKNRIPFDRFNTPYAFILFLVQFAVSEFVHGISREFLFGFTERGEGFIMVIMYFFFFFVASMIEKEKIKYIVLYFLMGLGLVNAVMTIANELIWEIPIANHPPYSTVFHNINFYAYFLTIIIMLSAALVLKEKSRGRKIFAFAMLCMNTAILAMNNTFGCFVACFVAFIFMIVDTQYNMPLFMGSVLRIG